VEAVRAGRWPRGAALLDVGCGAGSNVLYLARQGYRAHGVDLAPGAIAAARARAVAAGLPVDLRAGDALALPYPAGSLDGAIDNGCFHTLPAGRRREYADELARVLRPGAMFLLAWVAREERRPRGPPYRLSVEEVADALEHRFLVHRIELRTSSGRWGLVLDVALLERRTGVQPPRFHY